MAHANGRAVGRNYRAPTCQPTLATLYPDGRLALAWTPALDAPSGQDGVDLVLPDLLIVNLPVVDEADALALYEQAHEEFAATKHAWHRHLELTDADHTTPD